MVIPAAVTQMKAIRGEREDRPPTFSMHLCPSTIAPNRINKEVKMIAERYLTKPDPTAGPNTLAASFAPNDHPKNRPPDNFHI